MTRFIAAALSLALLSGCAATLTLRNERPGTVKDVLVKVGPQSYSVPELAAGAENVTELKVKPGGDLNVNYTAEDGRTNYTSGKTPWKSGESGKWLLRLNKASLLTVERQK
jgi:hypothetical protein